MRRGGGGGRQFNNTNPRPLMTMGSMVSNQNQFGLQDIDLELELLKRKREIIEKQQEMLRNEYSGESSFSLISNLYSEPRGGGFYGEGSGAGKKRPNVWEHEAGAPKRFTTNAGPRHNYTSQSTFKSQYKPKNSQQSYQPRAQSNYNSYKGKPKPPPAKKRSDFNPSKVTKQSSAQPPNKLRTYPTTTAQKLLTSAAKASEQLKEPLILRADREPSNQLQGRLGLALGYLVKEIKAQVPQYGEMSKSLSSQILVREMKKTLRERLRVALMGKYVGSLDEVIKVYREVYPPDTDRDIVMKTIEKDSGRDFIPVESDDPHEFFITNMGILMFRRLDEMFAKLSEMYCIEKANQKKLKAQEKDKKGDPKDNNSKETTIDITNDENQENSTNDDQNTSTTDQQKDDKDEDKDDQNKEETADKEEQGKKENNEILNKYISMARYQELDRLMNAKLPIMLRKFIPQIQKMMKNDLGYRRCANQIRHEIKKKLTKSGSVSQPITVDDDELEADKNKESGTPKGDSKYVPLPYFVKILGRPSLPKRKAMQEFFEKYKPKSIKKHRTVHNLLFVGFTDKEVFDSILEADGTQIGRSTLSIRVSERSNKPQEKEPKNEENEDQVKLINSELDEQITDLLDSIKKSEGLTDDEEKQDDEVIKITDVKTVKKEEGDGKVADDKKEGGDEVGDQNDVTVIDDSSQDVTLIDDNSQGETEKIEGSEENLEQESTEIVNSEDTDTNVDNSEINNENGQTTENSELGKAETQNSESEKVEDIEAEKKDAVSELKNPGKDVKSTPTRASTRLAGTPSSVRTRRASKLANE